MSVWTFVQISLLIIINKQMLERKKKNQFENFMTYNMVKMQCINYEYKMYMYLSILHVNTSILFARPHHVPPIYFIWKHEFVIHGIVFN